MVWMAAQDKIVCADESHHPEDHSSKETILNIFEEKMNFDAVQ